MSGEQYAAGWYPDPSGRFEYRYHNGRAWTSDVSSDGTRYVDGAGPLASAPAAAPASPGDGRNGFAVAAMVLGICAVGIGWLPFVFAVALVAALLAIVFGVIGLRRSRAVGSGRGFALTGVVTGVVGIAACAGGLVFTMVFLDAFDAYENPEPHTAEIVECTLTDRTATIGGTIVNRGDDTTDFSIRIDVVRPGTDNTQRSVRVTVEDVAPEATAAFATSVRVALDAIECRVADVNGPLPFGVQP